MNRVRATLVTEGSSDRALLHIIRWCILQLEPSISIKAQHADLRNLRNPPKALRDKIRVGLGQYPCDALFIYIDSDNKTRGERVDTIRGAIEELRNKKMLVPGYVCVIPVRALESWLLFDEESIRYASGNPSGRQTLALPKLSTIEDIATPKEMLHALIKQASGKTGRRLKQLNISQVVQLIAERSNDFSPLRGLRAFHEFELELGDLIRRQT